MARFTEGPYMQGESAGCHGFEFPDCKIGPNKTVVFDQEHCTADVEVDANVKSDTRPIKGTTKISEDDKRRRLLVETLLASLKAFNLAVDLWVEEELNDRPNS